MTQPRRGLLLTLLIVFACRPTGPDASAANDATGTVTDKVPAADTAVALAERPLAVRHATADADRAIALDSCAKLDRDARPQRRVPAPDEVIPPPREGSWSSSRIAATTGFTMELPVAASAFRVTPDSGFAVDSFPGCRYSCLLTVRFRRDSLHEGASEYVDRLRREAIARGEDGAEWAIGPSRSIQVDGRPAVLAENPCGDCTSSSLYVSRGDTIAEIEYSVDDREGYQPGIACRLARVAQSFQWP